MKRQQAKTADTTLGATTRRPSIDEARANTGIGTTTTKHSPGITTTTTAFHV
jgi:hypothetical protein